MAVFDRIIDVLKFKEMGVGKLGNSIVKKISSVALSLGMLVSFATVSSAQEPTSGGKALSNSEITPFGGAQVGGGNWEYDHWTHGWLNAYKTVYSDYWHPDKVHGSSATLGAATPARDCVAKDKTSHAQMTKKTDATAYVYWNTSCTQ